MRLRPLFLFAFIALVSLVSAQSSRQEPREKPYVPPKRWAIVIGAQEYTEFGKLKFPAKDAKDFAQLLIKDFVFEPSSVKLITDAPDSEVKPTAENIKKALEEQIADKRLDKGDLFIFFFAGHGIGTPNGDFLLPTNANNENAEKVGIRAKDVLQAYVDAGLKNVLVIADACRAGEKNSFGADLYEIGRKANIAIMLGCAPGSRSYEYQTLGHGAFTSFLLKELRNKENLSPVSGALWVSKVASQVEEKVAAYTERDYPTNPQKPSLATDKSRDILLGSFLSRAAKPVAAKALLLESQRLDKDHVQFALSGYANQMYAKLQFADAVEVFKTMESLDSIQPGDLYVFAFALEELGRVGESQRIFSKLRQQNENPFLQQIAYLFDPSQSITAPERIKAANKAWELDPSVSTGRFVWAALQIWNLTSEVITFLPKLLALEDLDPKTRAFMEAQLDAAKGDWPASIGHLRKASSLPGDYPDNDALSVHLFISLVFSGQVSEIPKFLDEVIKTSEGMTAHWLLLKADFQKEKGDRAGVMVSVKRALKADLSPADLLHILRLVGGQFPLVAPEVIKRADEFPLSWKALLAKTLATKAGKPAEEIAMALDQVINLSDDGYPVVLEWFRIWDEIFIDKLADKSLDYPAFQLAGYIWSELLANDASKFGYDMFAWLLFEKYALTSEKTEQLKVISDLYLGPSLKGGWLDSKLYVPYLIASMNVGDSKTVEQLYQPARIHPPERVDIAWVTSMYWAIAGDIAKARATMPKADSTVYGKTGIGLKAYLDVLEGKTPALDRLAVQCKDDVAAMQFIALAYAKQGKWAIVEPLMNELHSQRILSLTFLQAKLTEVYFQRLLAAKKPEVANEFAFDIMVSGRGNPLYEKIHFSPAKSVADFAGKASFDIGCFALPEEVSRGVMSMEISAAGEISGTLKITETVYSLKGVVDQFGNVKINVSDKEVRWSMTGKVPPFALYKSMPRFTSFGMLYLLLDSKGQALNLMARPK